MTEKQALFKVEGYQEIRDPGIEEAISAFFLDFLKAINNKLRLEFIPSYENGDILIRIFLRFSPPEEVGYIKIYGSQSRQKGCYEISSHQLSNREHCRVAPPSAAKGTYRVEEIDASIYRQNDEVFLTAPELKKSFILKSTLHKICHDWMPV